MLAFVFGASQMRDSGFAPDSVLQEQSEFVDVPEGSLYYDCIQSIQRAKSGCPFERSSPRLHELTERASWQVVYDELFTYFEQEVVNKHPVIKHLKFGSILQFNKSN